MPPAGFGSSIQIIRSILLSVWGSPTRFGFFGYRITGPAQPWTLISQSRCIEIKHSHGNCWYHNSWPNLNSEAKIHTKHWPNLNSETNIHTKHAIPLVSVHLLNKEPVCKKYYLVAMFRPMIFILRICVPAFVLQNNWERIVRKNCKSPSLTP